MFGGFFLYKIGFYFVLASFTKLWLSIYLSDFYLLKTLEITKQAEGDGFSIIPEIAWWIIILEFIIGIGLIFLDRKNMLTKK